MDKALRLLDGTYVMNNTALKDALKTGYRGLSTVERFLDELAQDKDGLIFEDFKALYELDGQDNAIAHIEMYNFCVNVCLHVKRKNLGKGQPLLAQDEDDYVMEVYKHAFGNLMTSKTKKALSFDDFKYYVSVIAYGVYSSITYQVHRQTFEDSIDAIQTNKDGVRISFYSFDEMLKRRVERADNAQTLSDKAQAKTNALICELKDKINECLPKSEQPYFWALVNARLDDNSVLTSSQRRRLSEYRTMIQANYHNETIAQSKERRIVNKAVKLAQTETDKAIKLAQKIANRRARYEERKASFVRAIENAMNDTDDISIKADLCDLQDKVNMYTPTDKDDDKALKPFRLQFKAITDVLLASTPIQRENAKTLRKAMKSDKTV